MKFKLQHVYYMPKELEPGVLYVSLEFGAAAHLCACGCNSKVRTPLGPTEWVLEEAEQGPTLWPSIGNWQLPCQSHYLIDRGEVIWAIKWTQKQIVAGRQAEEKRRQEYYDALYRKQDSFTSRLWRWLKDLRKK